MEVLQYCPESTRVLPREYSSTFGEVLKTLALMRILRSGGEILYPFKAYVGSFWMGEQGREKCER